MIFFIALVENTRIWTVWSKAKSSRMPVSGERYQTSKRGSLVYLGYTFLQHATIDCTRKELGLVRLTFLMKIPSS
jgi:hypothetical protein